MFPPPPTFSLFLTFDRCNRSDQPYIPPTKPYELSELVSDLVLFSRAMLKPRGRLVFFLPTVTEEYEGVDIDAMMCDGMEVIANSLQDFGNWGRRVRLDVSKARRWLTYNYLQLITIRKCTDKSYPPPMLRRVSEVEVNEGDCGAGGHVPAHKDFRVKYFQGFKKPAS